MTQSALIVGSGPAAAAVALACSAAGVRPTVLDIGGELEPEREALRRHLELALPRTWSNDQLARLAPPPVSTSLAGPPQKLVFGSDFPLRDLGQRRGIDSSGGANDAVVSSAYGGFSRLWGAQVMPFSDATFRTWPVTADEMAGHYRTVLGALPYAAEQDDLAADFPLLAPAQPLPPLAERTVAVLDRYARHRGALARRGLVVGRARLAFDAADCVRCGLCMTGCPRLLIHSATRTFDALRRDGAVDYRPGLLVVRVREDGDEAVVTARELATGRLREFRAGRVFLACGAVGTTRLVAGSLRLEETEIQLQESAQFLLPFLSRVPTACDPRTTDAFTLNQFNLAVLFDEDAFDVAHLHFYPYNPAVLERLPAALRQRWSSVLTTHLLRRLSVAFGYLPSWRSPAIVARVGRASADELPELRLSGRRAGTWRNPMVRDLLGRLVRAAPQLDLWPILPALAFSAPAKSYHFGGSFPHVDGEPRSQLQSDVLGRIGPWRRIHAVDGSVLPSIAATTFTLTVMANAHRIAESSLHELH